MGNKESTLFHTQIIDTTSEYKAPFTRSHDQSCCERVEVDQTQEEIYVPQIKGEFNRIEYWTAPEDGFFVKLYLDEEYKGQVYYPCYNEQNGCYDDEIELTIDGSKYYLQELSCIRNEIN